MKHKLTRFYAPLALALMLTLGGCAKQPAGTIAPVYGPSAGCYNAFDCSTGQWLLTIQSTIEQAKIGVPEAQKPLLRTIISNYNLAEKAYTTYHALAKAGAATAAQQADVQLQVDSVKSGLAQLGAK